MADMPTDSRLEVRLPIIRTFYGSDRRIAVQLQRETHRMAEDGCTLESRTSVPGMPLPFPTPWTRCLVATYHHQGVEALAPTSETMRLLYLRDSDIISKRQFDRAMHSFLK